MISRSVLDRTVTLTSWKTLRILSVSVAQVSCTNSERSLLSEQVKKKKKYLLRYTIQAYIHNQHKVDRMLGFFSSRPNWDPPLPHTQASVFPPPPLWLRRKGTLACGRGGGGVPTPIRTRGRHFGTLDIYTPYVTVLEDFSYTLSVQKREFIHMVPNDYFE